MVIGTLGTFYDREWTMDADVDFDYLNRIQDQPTILTNNYFDDAGQFLYRENLFTWKNTLLHIWVSSNDYIYSSIFPPFYTLNFWLLKYFPLNNGIECKSLPASGIIRNLKTLTNIKSNKMKKLIIPLGFAIFTLLLSSCGMSYALIDNQNQNSTQVHLMQENYKVVERVTGSAEVDYVLFFGGWKKRNLYADAYNNLVNTANLESGSKALINVLTEEYIGGFPPFYTKRTITVSAHVIEFSGK